MKILYNDISLEKDFKHFRELYYFHTGVYAIKKKGYLKNTNYLRQNLFIMFISILLSILSIYIYNTSNKTFIDILSIILIAISLFCIVMYIFAIIGYITYYRNFKKTEIKKNKNCLEINEDGIIDKTDATTFTSKWDQLTHIIIGSYYIVITTNFNIIYILPIEIKNKLLTGINKYNDYHKIKIIEKN